MLPGRGCPGEEGNDQRHEPSRKSDFSCYPGSFSLDPDNRSEYAYLSTTPPVYNSDGDRIQDEGDCGQRTTTTPNSQ
jgi:hypothetical protein